MTADGELSKLRQKVSRLQQESIRLQSGIRADIFGRVTSPAAIAGAAAAGAAVALCIPVRDAGHTMPAAGGVFSRLTAAAIMLVGTLAKIVALIELVHGKPATKGEDQRPLPSEPADGL